MLHIRRPQKNIFFLGNISIDHLCFFAIFLFSVFRYSLHSGDPGLEGEKWVGPLWVWDPHFSSGSLPFKTLNDYGIPWELKAVCVGAAACDRRFVACC